MGIRLDWEIENERSRAQSSGEDPQGRRQRGRIVRRLLILLLILVILGGAAVLVVTNRLQEVEAQIRSNLIATVENEVAALRIGDRNTFTSIQRSESATWLQAQQDLYDAYQQLKADADLVLSGRVFDVAIDGARGRVQVEETVGGVPYARTWFYFRYEDGWRHVPADYTFWGEPREAADGPLVVRYYAVDQAFVDAFVPRVRDWVVSGCALVVCPVVPTLAVDVVPDEALTPSQAGDDPAHLLVPSPFVGAARLDTIFTTEAQIQVAALVADRLVASAQPMVPQPNADAAYLRQAVVSWLVKRFTGQETNAFSIDSLAQTYEDAAVGRLLAALTPDASMSVLASAAGVPSLADMTLDWRDLLTWRLTLETRVIAQGDQNAFLMLYDVRDPAVQSAAIGRFNAGDPGETWVVTTVVTDAADRTLLRATALVRSSAGDRTQEVLFRLVDNVWKRAS